MNERAPTDPVPAAAASRSVYRVLARKYRPKTFAELIGQSALVRTLSNAIGSGRIAQAFMLTGVRGVGKTTTARIVARALNCVGPDGRGGPTIDPCGVCTHCQAIAQDRHVDVMEMDAASHTGVEDIREILDGVRYGPVSARYKLYIIDEVHMLSKNAFNALLKTLEEPPEHVKFVFATTEVRKVPITVLSRCQRFDLRRVDVPELIEHFRNVCTAEGVTAETEALALIARAADGSVRDGLSLLDQAIALGGLTVAVESVRDMLGLADRTVILDLLEAALAARPPQALAVLTDLYRKGADPVVVVRDLLDLTHGLTRLKVVPEARHDPGLPEAERVRGGAMADRLSVPALARAWQILLKGFGEVQAAPLPQQAAEMLVIRLAHAAQLPPPAELIRRLQAEGNTGRSAAPAGPSSSMPTGPGTSGTGTSPAAVTAAPRASATGPIPPAGPSPAAPTAAWPTPAPASGGAQDAQPTPIPNDFRALVRLFAERREGDLYGHLFNSVHLVRYEPGLIEIRPHTLAPPTLANRVAQVLNEWTGRRWVVAISNQPGEPTLGEQAAATRERERAEAARHPLVKAVLDAFPGAELREVRRRQLPPDAAPGSAAGSGDADFDGFEEEGEYGS